MSPGPQAQDAGVSQEAHTYTRQPAGNGSELVTSLPSLRPWSGVPARPIHGRSFMACDEPLSTEAVDNSVDFSAYQHQKTLPYCIFITMVKK
jgi:hypothetical protein